MATIYLGLGSNKAPEKNLRLGIGELRRCYGELQISAVYKNTAVGFAGEDFLNVVVQLRSNDTPLAICREIELIHNLSGRERGANKWEARPLDIDLLLYNDLIMDEPPVRVPRSDILEYSFVLRPLAELAPELVHPVTGKTMLSHWQKYDAASHPLDVTDVVL
jgi:2-amino-4-hydroxy-6-hydroxymethyldihydropteridine diphosphokinase